MKRISSAATSFYKKGVPALWCGFVAIVVLLVLMSGPVTASTMFLLGPVVMTVFGYILMKKVVWDLVDEVHDAYEFLIVRTRGREHQLPLTDIMNVAPSMQMNPPRITLKLTGPSSAGPLGPEVAFMIDRPSFLNPFAKSEVAEDLIVRVDRARRLRGLT